MMNNVIVEGTIAAERLRRATANFLSAEQSGDVKKAAQEKRKMHTYHRALEKRGLLYLAEGPIYRA